MLKIMLLIVMLACIGPFFIKAPNGEPLLTVADFAPDVSLASILERLKQDPGLASLTGLAKGIDISGDASDGEQAEQGTGKNALGSVTKVYKWRDEQGVWQFSDGSNVAEGAALVEISHQINLMPALDVAKQGESQIPATQKTQVGAFDFSKLPAGVTSVAPEQLVQMGRTIETFQKAIDDQSEALEALAPSNP
jgi:hypothetical protein